MILNMEIVLDYLGRPNGITRVLKSGERQERTRDSNVSRTQPDLAGFEDGGRRQIFVGFKCSPFRITVKIFVSLAEY